MKVNFAEQSRLGVSRYQLSRHRLSHLHASPFPEVLAVVTKKGGRYEISLVGQKRWKKIKYHLVQSTLYKVKIQQQFDQKVDWFKEQKQRTVTSFSLAPHSWVTTG